MSAQPYLQSVSDTAWIGERHEPPTAPTTAGAPTTPPTDGQPPAGGGPARPAQKQRAEKSLPTDRLSFDKQVEALGSIAQLSGHSRRAVTAEDVSASLGLKGNTGGLSNKFFRDSGWVESAGRGAYVATEPLVAYRRHLDVDSADLDGARAYLVQPARSSWYWQEIQGIVQGAGVRQTMVLHTLAKVAGASSSHMAQLNLIIDWLVWLGLVVRDGELLRAARGGDSGAAAETTVDEILDQLDEAADAEPETGAAAAEVAEAEPAQAARREQPQPDDEAMFSMHFSVRITAADAAKLNGEQLQALLAFAEKMRG